MKFSIYADEASKRALEALAQPPYQDDDLDYIRALAQSDDLHKSLESAGLSDHQKEGFLAIVVSLRMNYSVFRKNLNDALAAQRQVAEAALALDEALRRLEQYDFMRPEFHYSLDFLRWAGFSVQPRGGIDAATPLWVLADHFKRLVADSGPKESDFVAAAIASQKSSAPHEFARALLWMTPTEHQMRLCPAIATAVSLSHAEGMTTSEVKRLLKDLGPKLP